MLEEDDSVGSREVEPQAPHMGGQEEHVHGGVTVEPVGVGGHIRNGVTDLL